MRDALTVAKKELRAFLTDKVILFQIFILPFVIVFGYCSLFTVLSSTKTDENYQTKAYGINIPIYFQEAFKELDIVEAPKKDEKTIEKYKQEVKDKTLDLLIIFPEDFRIAEPGEEDLSNVDIFYNSSKTESVKLYGFLVAVFDELQPRTFLVNYDFEEEYNMFDKDAEIRKMLGGVIPTVVFMAVFMICMNLASNSIAGDKEHGFLNTLLVTPIRRSNLAAGKSISILVISVFSSVSSFIGMAVSLPRIADAMEMSSGAGYGISAYVALFVSVVTALFVLSAGLLIVSTLSKDVKQATTIAPAFIFIVMIPSLLSSTEGFSKIISDFGFKNYFIPVWNSVMVMQDVLEMDYSLVALIPVCIINILVACIGVFIVGKLFENEKVVNNG